MSFAYLSPFQAGFDHKSITIDTLHTAQLADLRMMPCFSNGLIPTIVAVLKLGTLFKITLRARIYATIARHFVPASVRIDESFPLSVQIDSVERLLIINAPFQS